MLTNIKATKIINGRRYYNKGVFTNKKSAEIWAKGKRSSGFSVRIEKKGNKWVTWLRGRS